MSYDELMAEQQREIAALRLALETATRENQRLRDMIEIEREGQRSMAGTLAEIRRLSDLNVAINRPAPLTSDFHTSCDWCKRDIPNACYAVLCSDCDRRGNTALFAPPADAATEAVRDEEPFCECGKSRAEHNR